MDIIFDTFLSDVKPTQIIWALKDPESDDWVILDSLQYEESEVMPLWSTKEQAERHLTEDWENFVCASISIADWLEFWVEDLITDNIIIGLNWIGEENDIEMDLQEFSENIAKLETI